MASNKYRGMNKQERTSDLAATLNEVMKLPKGVRKNALLNTDAASDLASTGEGHAGATLNVNSFELAKPGDPIHFIGGEKDVNGNPIDTHFEGGYGKPGEVGRNAPFISPLSILQHASRIRESVGGRRNSNVGLWLDPAQKRIGVQVDASGNYPTEAKAIKALADRPAEKAGWSMEKMDSFDNPAYDPTKDPKSKKYQGE